MTRLVFGLLFCFSCFEVAAEDHQVWQGDWEANVYIDGLQEDLFQKYIIKKSRGPKWGEDVDRMSDLADRDFYERSTYWAESGYPEMECPDFTEQDFDSSYAEYGLRWEAVKKKTGSSKTVYYLATYQLTLVSSAKTCTYFQSPEEKFVFLNKRDESGDPIYLGVLSEDPPPQGN
ncbi:MAG: hypothetical protein AAF202_03630 [Pseudomonadota bacterium]